jgi:2-isopropylmalate synthase
MEDRVRIFDSTLRDGEQAPGIALDPDQKVAIAMQLARLGVDIIEAGFPISSPGDFRAVTRIAQEVQGPTIAALARAHYQDVDRAWQAIKDDYTGNVEYSPEDATRSDPDFVVAVCQAAVDAGANTINIPDTVGYATPGDYGTLIRRVVDEVMGDRADVVVSAHCHNDLGLAVANSLAAVEAGARQVEGAINGIGERAGNTSIEEVVMALRVRADAFGVGVGITTEEIYETSRLVSEQTGYPIQFNKAVVGRNAFAHESGIHQHGVLRDRSTYEIMDPMAVGMGNSVIVIGKHSGRAAFRHSLHQLGIEANDAVFEAAFSRMKSVADWSGELSPDQIREIVEEVASGIEVLDGVTASFQ